MNVKHAMLYLAMTGAVLVLAGCSHGHPGVQPADGAAQPSGAATGRTAVASASTPPASATSTASRQAPAKIAFAPPPRSAIPDNPFGQLVRKGEQIFTHTGKYAGQYVGDDLNCSSCHLDAGRRAGSAPLWAAYVRYPRYRAKNHKVNSYTDRLQGCFRFSMNGKPPPADGEIIRALTAYSYWLAKGAPTGENLPGYGFPKLAPPAEAPSYVRGEKVYASHCALCHGDDGQGQRSAGTQVFPPLWGPHSFNWGAGMHKVNTAAAFIKANMPFSRGGTLTDQDAWDVAMFMDSHERPQDPRYTGSVAGTRKQFDGGKLSMYGKVVNGHLLGSAALHKK